MLTEDNRTKLDGIVQQMTSNKEDDSTIQFVVDDFKKKYDTPEEKPKPEIGSLTRNAGNLIKGALPIAGSIAGGALGAAGGLAVGGPVGAWAGGAAGAGLGASAGEFAKQLVNKGTKGTALNPSEIGKTGLEFGALEAVGGPILSAAGKGLGIAGEALYKTAIPTSEKEAALIQTYKASKPLLERIVDVVKGTSKAPTTVADTAFDKGLAGTESMLGVQAKTAGQTLWKDLVQPQLDAVKGKVNLNTFFKQTEDAIIKKNPELSRQSGLLDALRAVKEDYKGVKSVSYPEFQKLKEGWAEFVPEKVYKGKPIAGLFNDVRNILSNQARTTIYDKLGPEVKQAYFDYGNLKAIQQLGQKAMVGTKTSFPTAKLWDLIKNVPVTFVETVGGQGLYKVGQGIELVGAPGARVVRDVLFAPTRSADTKSSPAVPSSSSSSTASFPQ